MCYALEPLRAAGIRLVYYLNDICALAKTKEEMKFHSQTGLQNDINNTSNWQSTAIYQISSERPDKEPSSTAPELGDDLFAITRKLEGDALVVTASSSPQWTANNIGVTSRHVETADYRKEEETDLSINVKELKIIEFALQLHAREFEGALIKIFSDSIMALNRSIKWQEKAAVRMETTIQVLQDDARNLGSSKVRCLRNESEHMSTLVLESEPRPTSRSDQCMEQRVEGNRPVFAPILETSTKTTTKNEDRQRQESCVDRTKLTKPVLVTDGPKTKLSPANELQDLQTMVLDCMAIIRWYQAKKQNLKSVSVEYS
ncbi:hypothetical protein G6F46_000787 [Rhizopus delemar]|nr:hypothetical protein G6F55_000703 [Rhizopus delemar]KAG1553344.1 hypothetical protein G6F51_000660 [Rhizopus arrhizus]KAG1503611.1 hypothetical protein G6F54_001556 [Rhizopus delemar]KAG1528933.1 hypothetical protein G6F52_000194 [Rhizopus delemar]KAG1575906.1 hypothetical protein G6F50_000674 [Rhizopus delemar]